MENTAAIRVGRLLEVRVGAGYRSPAEVDAFFGTIARACAGRSGRRRFVTVADWRDCPVLSEDVARRAVEGMARANPLIERSAALVVGHSATALLQFVRLVRETRHAQRRLFQDAGALVEWLADALTPEEMARLREFLGEGRAGVVREERSGATELRRVLRHAG